MQRINLPIVSRETSAAVCARAKVALERSQPAVGSLPKDPLCD
ncbi:MAG TPA: hypothetical protein PKI30_02250 [Bacillota bacterium]|nr:hypothetical protein [Bacillota bacterium]